MTEANKDVLMQSIRAIRHLTEKVERYESRDQADIAVIGMACRFPGSASTAADFWSLLEHGRSAIREVGADRWSQDRFFDPDYAAPGKVVCRYAGLVDGIYDFDPEFFGIAAPEAESLDPQQRLLLESTWLALEDAGLNAAQLRGSNTGTFIGIGSNDYGIALMADAREINAYVASGNSVSMAAGRLAYFFDFTGPSVAIDTACSSSLVAVHEACAKLRRGDCELAIAGGVNAVLLPNASINFSRARMLTPEKDCHVFDARAKGYIRGEGCGVVVLKRAADALKDGDRIHAVIKGSSVNHDGHTSGLTVPSGPAQEAVLRAALAHARISPLEVSYLEAHGTGTALGDPVEANALARVFSQERNSERPLFVGSVKANIGHLEAAAGIAGLIKVVLMLRHRQIPPQVGFERLNSKISWDASRFVVSSVLRDMPVDSAARALYCGVSSFGFSGTNAHVVLGSAPEPHNQAAIGNGTSLRAPVVTVSAKSAPSLRALTRRVVDYLSNGDDDTLAAVSYTSTMRRVAFSDRIAAVASSREEMIAQLLEALDRYESRQRGKEVVLFLSAEDDIESIRGTLQSFDGARGPAPEDIADPTPETIAECMNPASDAAGRESLLASAHCALLKCLGRLGVLPDKVVACGIRPEPIAAMLSGATPLTSDFAYFDGRAERVSVIEADGKPVRTFPAAEAASETAIAGALVLCLREPPAYLGSASLLCALLGPSAFMRALAALFANGGDIHWSDVEPGTSLVAFDFPGYCFDRRTIKSRRIDAFLMAQPDEPPAIHPLILEKIALPDRIVYRLELSSPHLAFLDQHRVRGRSVLPASLILDLLHRVARDAVASDIDSLVSVTFRRPVDAFLSDREYLLHVDSDSEPASVSLWSRQTDAGKAAPWTLHVSANFRRARSGDDLSQGALQTHWPQPVECAEGRGKSLDVEALYAHHQENGITLGSLFRCVRALSVEHDAIFGDVRSAKDTLSPPLVRATVILDGCFQATAALRSSSADLFLLGSIGQSIIAGEVPADCRVYVRRRPELTGHDPDAELHCDITVADATGEVRCRFSDVTFSRVNKELTPSESHVESCLYTQRWVRAASASQTPDSGTRHDELAPLSQLIDPVQDTLHLGSLAKRYDLDEYNQYRARIEALCLDLIRLALRTLGWRAEGAPARSREKLRDLLRITAKQRRLFDHCLVQLQAAGFISGTGANGDWTLRQLSTDTVDFAGIDAEFPAFRAETDFIKRCGTALPEVLSGRQDPLGALFLGDAFQGTEQIYRDSPISKVLNGHLAQLVAMLSGQGRRVRILEIGAGTGGTTRSVLERLADSRIETYCYTDISPWFLDHARTQFAEHGRVEYRLLNIEEPVGRQGFEPGAFDIVIAANVLHATRSLAETLRHVLRLLSPRGYLVLRECIKPQLSADISFGMTEGWWRFEDRALRPDYPLLSGQQWRDLLSTSGFQDAHFMLPAANSAEALIVAQAGGTVPGRRWLIVHGGQEAARELAQRLSVAGELCTALSWEAALQMSITDPIEALVCFAFADSASPCADSAARAIDVYERMIALCRRFLGSQALRAGQLWCVTIAAEKVVDEDCVAGLAESVMTGVLKTAALEYPDRIGGAVDLERDDASVVAPLIEWLERPRGRHYVALRNGEIHCPRLEKLRPEALDDSRHRGPAREAREGVVLITGGLGNIGFAIAASLAQQPGARLVLIGRDFSDQTKQARLSQLRSYGATIACHAVELSDESRMQTLFAELADQGWIVAHIIHAAGVGGDEALSDIRPGQHRDITLPKISGTWNLSRYCDPHATQSFIVISTMVALWGAKNKTHYVLANHFADRVVQFRRSRGLAGLTIQLGPVSGGMLSEAGERSARELGVATFDVDTVARAVVDLLWRRAGELALVDIDWARFNPYYAHTWLSSYFEALACAPRSKLTASAAGRQGSAAAAEFALRYRSLSEGAREPFLEATVIEVLREVLGTSAEASSIKTTGFHDLGMDSLLTLSFARALSERTQVALSSLDVFDNANVVNLSRRLKQRLRGETPPAPGRESSLEATPEADKPAPLIPTTAREVDLERELVEMQELLGD